MVATQTSDPERKATPPPQARSRKNRSGQAIVFLVMALAILAFVVLWNYDLHKILHIKSISRDGGDAAALAAARWQGIALNLVGDLNIIHAMSIKPDGDDADIAPAISNIQARLCYAGPMIAFMAAQQAAKNNGIFQNDDFTTFTRDHAGEVRNDYPGATGAGGAPLFPEPYPGCWEEYADMLDYIASEGIAAGADNARLYSDYTGGHTLLNPGFYSAIASRDWCWWYNNEPTLLSDYVNFLPCWWPDLPAIPHVRYVNSEIFGLGLRPVIASLASLADRIPLSDTLTNAAAERDIIVPPTSTNYMDTVSTWYCYDDSLWTPWDAMSTSGSDPFPAAGSLRPQYDYAGADAVVRVEAKAGRLTPGPNGTTVSNTIIWTAAAKPFGYLNEEDRPDSLSLVIPAFHEVALFPVDASSSPAGGSYNLEWRHHIEEHLPTYMDNGPGPASSCPYCEQLVIWEDPVFRADGVTWLSTNYYRCIVPSGGGTHRGGGTSHGH